MTLKVDTKGRITVGSYLPKGTSSVEIKTDNDGNLLLIPFIEIPIKEAWIYKNPQALSALLEGVKQASSGQLKDFDPEDLPDFGDEEDA